MEHDITRMLQAAIQRKKQETDVKTFAKEFSKELAGAISPDDISRGVENKIVNTLTPMIQKLIERDSLSAETIRSAISQIKIPDVYIDTQDINNAIREAFGSVSIPQPKVHVTIPPINIPEVRMPDEMSVKGWAELIGVFRDKNNPIPVQLRDGKGNPINLFENLTTLVSQGGGGGKHDFFTVKGFSQSAYAELMNADGRLKVSMESGSTGLTDTELRATSVPVEQVSGSMWSTAVKEIFGSTITALLNGDNRIPVSVETGGSGLTDAELRASAVPVIQVSGAANSTNVISTVGLTDTQLRASSVPVEQVSGSSWSTNVLSTVGLTDTQIRATSLPVEQVSGARWSTEATQSGTWTVAVSGTVASTGAYLLNGDGTYRDTMPISGPVTVSGAISSTVATGPTVADAVDDGSAPVQGGGIARTANPTAVADGDVVKSSHDDLGRQLMRPVQVRDLVVTAYASLANGTETTLLAATAGSFHDLIYVMGANNSDVAVTVNIRPVLAGNIIMTLRVPANGTACIVTPVPLPQSASDTGNAWTADMGDVTGTTVYLTALFTREV